MFTSFNTKTFRYYWHQLKYEQGRASRKKIKWIPNVEISSALKVAFHLSIKVGFGQIIYFRNIAVVLTPVLSLRLLVKLNLKGVEILFINAQSNSTMSKHFIIFVTNFMSYL